MTDTTSRIPERVRDKVPGPGETAPLAATPESDQLAADLVRVENAVRQERTRAEQERLAKLRKLARFD